MTQYYIDISGTKDGPHDLVTIMRRIRAQKITPETGIYVDDASFPTPASQLQDTALFFGHGSAEEGRHIPLPALRVANLWREGWRFTSENSIMTVFAGGALLLSMLFGAVLTTALGAKLGAIIAWVPFIILHYIYMVSCLRMYRGQPFSLKFWQDQINPILPSLILAGTVVGLMMIGGFMLLVLPGFFVAVYYAFTPFFILDRRMSLVEAMSASRLLVCKHRGRYQLPLAIIFTLHIGCLLLILPVPLAMPIFSAALARFYEELSTS